MWPELVQHRTLQIADTMALAARRGASVIPAVGQIAMGEQARDDGRRRRTTEGGFARLDDVVAVMRSAAVVTSASDRWQSMVAGVVTFGRGEYHGWLGVSSNLSSQ